MDAGQDKHRPPETFTFSTAPFPYLISSSYIPTGVANMPDAPGTVSRASHRQRILDLSTSLVPSHGSTALGSAIPCSLKNSGPTRGAKRSYHYARLARP